MKLRFIHASREARAPWLSPVLGCPRDTVRHRAAAAGGAPGLRLLVVFIFGLIHGLGFAGAMATRLGSSSSLIVGLLGINLGVEFGQLAVISVALIATFWIRDLKKYRQFVVIPGSLVIAAMGLWWVIERIHSR